GGISKNRVFVTAKLRRFQTLTTNRYDPLEFPGVAHFISRGDKERIRMRSHSQAKVFRGKVCGLHSADFVPQFVSRVGDMRIPMNCLVSQPDATEIAVPLAIAKPSSHL